MPEVGSPCQSNRGNLMQHWTLCEVVRRLRDSAPPEGRLHYLDTHAMAPLSPIKSKAAKTFQRHLARLSHPVAEATAWEFLVFLRNCLMHASPNTVTPVTEDLDGGAKELAGYTISANHPPPGVQPGSAELDLASIKRLGSEFARAFAGGYQLPSNQRLDATSGVVETRPKAKTT